MEVRPHAAILYRAITFLLILLGVLTGSAHAGTSVLGSKHDFSFGSTGTPFAEQFQIGAPGDFGPLVDEVCVFCHTPHSASTDAQSNTLLWNRINPQAGQTYKMYSSTTFTASIAAKPTGVSMMCMSCHDGVTSIAAGTLLNAPGSGNPQVSLDQFSDIPAPGAIGSVFKGQIGFGWGPNIGNAIPFGTTIDLSNDHPISFAWPTGKADLFASPQNVALRLFGGNRIECATCHLVHNPSIEPFLAMSNAGSAMCRACHIK